MRERNRENRRQKTHAVCFSRLRRVRSERGVVLLVVIVLSAAGLIIMTALLYMITSGTRASGMHKGYRTAAEAGFGGTDVFKEVIDLRGDRVSFETQLIAADLTPDFTTPSDCSGLSSNGTYTTGFDAKLLTSSKDWSAECDRSPVIDPDIPGSYDMKIEMGSTSKYDVYAKITSAIEGNSGTSGEELLNTGVVGDTGGIQVMSNPYLYNIETLAVSRGGYGERAKFSTLYQY